MEMTVKINLNDEQVEELELLQKAMNKANDGNEYTLEKVFDFIMLLSQTKRINQAIENAAYYYDEYYEDYPYEYGAARTKEILKKEKEVGHYLDTAYPNPRIVRD